MMKKEEILALISISLVILAVIVLNNIEVKGATSQQMNISIYIGPADNTPPNITVISPENKTYTSTTLDFNVSLNEEGDFCYYELYRYQGSRDGWVLNDSQYLTKYNSTYFNYTKIDLTNLYNYYIQFTCNDTVGNNATSEKVYFMINTSWSAPYSLIITPTSPGDGSTIQSSSMPVSIDFRFDVSSSNEIAICKLYINNNYVANSTSISTTETNTITYSLNTGTYSWYIWCKDVLENSMYSATRSLSVESSGDGDDGGCSNDCSVVGEKRCSGSKVEECGDYDSDDCLEWGVIEDCKDRGEAYECSSGACILQQECKENWTCSEWGKCEAGMQTRNCWDENNCGTFFSKPPETQTCEIGGLEITYQPADLDLIVQKNKKIRFEVMAREKASLVEPIMVFARWYLNGVKIKEDAGIMELTTSYELTPQENGEIKVEIFDEYDNEVVEWKFQVSEEKCKEKWVCDWTDCNSEGYQYAENCVDIHNCGTNAEKPSYRECSCIPKWECSKWGDCQADYTVQDILQGKTRVSGIKTRTCKDLNGCYEDKEESKSCNLIIPIEAKIVEWCQEEYLEIYDKETGELVSRMKYDPESGEISIGIIIGFEGYCDYCFDGIKDYDEEGVDCGGDGCPPCFGTCNVYLEKGWNFVSFCINPDEKDVAKVLQQLGDKYEYVLEWDEDKQEFKVYSVKGVKEFTEFNPKKSYFIFYDGTRVKLDLEGEGHNDFEFVLKQGWNSPFYPLLQESKIERNNFFNAGFDYILRWSRIRQEFMVYSSRSKKGEMTIKPGEGIMIYTNGGKIVYK